jgi:hypothetical protein
VHDALAGLGEAAVGQVVLQHRGGGFLDLQEQRVIGVASLEQHDERPGPDAAHAHDFAGHVRDLEVLQQVAPVTLQGGPVGAELPADHLSQLIGGDAGCGGQVTGGDDDRRLADDPVLTPG